jgi:signal-transduction protein with cAMP-binding, CBS, and nucleotidyltransferase domain
MKVADVMSYRPVVIDAYESVQTAALVMRSQVIGSLPVVEHGRLVGVVTDRDLALRGLIRGTRPEDICVRAVMSEAPATCQRGERLVDAVARMVERRVRRLVVVEDGAVIGVLSVDDLAMLEATRSLAARVLGALAPLRGDLDGPFAEPRT